MHRLSRPASPILRLADRFVVDRRLLRPGAVVEGADVGRPERPAVRVHALDTRETAGLAETLTAWEAAGAAGLPVARHVGTVPVDGLTCVVLDRLPVARPGGAVERAMLAAEAAVLVPALAERGVRVDLIAPASVGLAPAGRLGFAEPPLVPSTASGPIPPSADQARTLVERLAFAEPPPGDQSGEGGPTGTSAAQPVVDRFGWTAPARSAEEEVVPPHGPEEATPITAGPDGPSSPGLSTRSPIGGGRARGDRRSIAAARAPWVDRERLREVARRRLVVRGALLLIVVSVALLALGNRGAGDPAASVAVVGGAQLPMPPLPAPTDGGAVAAPTATASTGVPNATATPAGQRAIAGPARPARTSRSSVRRAGVRRPRGADRGATRVPHARRRRRAARTARAASAGAVRRSARSGGTSPPRASRRHAPRAPSAAPSAPPAPASPRAGGDPFGTL